jgi:hypothetical protein
LIPAAIHWRPDINFDISPSPKPAPTPEWFHVFDVFLPVQHLWQVVFENNLAALLNFIYVHFQEVPVLSGIGA